MLREQLSQSTMLVPYTRMSRTATRNRLFTATGLCSHRFLPQHPSE